MSNIDLLFLNSLQARYFKEINLSKRQLHVWCDLTGFEPEERESGKWRLFSPANVMSLITMKELKDHTGLTLTDSKELINFLAKKEFTIDVLNTWISGEEPKLVTDLKEVHNITKKQI